MAVTLPAQVFCDVAPFATLAATVTHRDNGKGRHPRNRSVALDVGEQANGGNRRADVIDLGERMAR